MARQRQYATAAERQKAYISRLKSGVPAPSPQKRQTRKLSRPKRIEALLSEAEDLLQSYTDWQENMPETLQDSEQGQKLQDTIDGLEQVVELLQGIDLPRGFGRD